MVNKLRQFFQTQQTDVAPDAIISNVMNAHSHRLFDFSIPKHSCYQSVFLINTPKIGLNNPPMAPALLQSIAKEMGCKTNFIDVNIDFHHHFENHSSIFRHWCELKGELSTQDENKLHHFISTLDLSETLWAYLFLVSIAMPLQLGS